MRLSLRPALKATRAQTARSRTDMGRTDEPQPPLENSTGSRKVSDVPEVSALPCVPSSLSVSVSVSTVSSDVSVVSSLSDGAEVSFGAGIV